MCAAQSSGNTKGNSADILVLCLGKECVSPRTSQNQTAEECSLGTGISPGTKCRELLNSLQFLKCINPDIPALRWRWSKKNDGDIEWSKTNTLLIGQCADSDIWSPGRNVFSEAHV